MTQNIVKLQEEVSQNNFKTASKGENLFNSNKIHIDPIAKLHEEARSFLNTVGLTFEEEFKETHKDEQIIFHVQHPEKKKKIKCWLKCSYLNKGGEIQGFCITFGAFHPSLPQHDTKTFWANSNYQFSDEDRKAINNRILEERQRAEERAKEEKKVANEKAKWCSEKYNNASVIIFFSSGQFPYFDKKGIIPSEVRYEVRKCYEEGSYTEEKVVLIPLRNIDGQIRAIQEIYPSKRKFQVDQELRDKNTLGKYSECFFNFGKLEDGKPICIAEGYATAGSIFVSTNYTSLMVVARTNILNVAKEIKRKYPNSEIIICGDDDIDTPSNPGRTDAENAARKISCKVCFPIFPKDKERDENGNAYTDFNDLMLVSGKKEVAIQIQSIKIVEQKKKEEAENSAEQSSDQINNLSDKANDILIPNGYRLRNDGVFYLKKTKDKEDKKENIVLVKICDPLWVEGRSRSYQGTDNGLLLKWIDMDGNIRFRTILRRQLYEQGNSIASDLSDLGLAIVYGNEHEVNRYLSSFRPAKTFLSVRNLGWVDSPIGNLTYVLPQEVITNNENQEDITYQPEKLSDKDIVNVIHTKGTLIEWQKNVLEPCVGNPLAVFSISLPLAGMLTKFAGTGSFGFNLSGFTSRGKTTITQVATSVVGCGADPGDAPRLSFIKKWNATANALEAIASRHNDNLLSLDELKTCPAKDFEHVIYNLFGGQGRSRLGRSCTLKDSFNWNTIVLSNGELTISDKLKETGSKIPGGLLVRFIDIPSDEAFINYHGQEPKDFIGNLKRMCGQFYGAAGREFISKLINKCKTTQDLRQEIQGLQAICYKKLSNEKKLNQEQGRVCNLFALLATAGVLAVEFKIFLIEVEEVLQNIGVIWEKWLSETKMLPDISRGIISLKDFIIRKKDVNFKPQFINDNNERRYGDTLGYIRSKDGYFLLTEEGMAEATKGFNLNQICKKMYAEKILLREEDVNRNQSKITIDGLGNLRLYVISDKIMNYEPK
jgi:putative DNA primase/helicase